MQVVFGLFDLGANGENFVLYNSPKTKEDETRGWKQIVTTMQSFILTLLRLWRNFDVHHLAYLFRVSEEIVTHTFITWINFMYIKFGSICIWPPLLVEKQTLPHSVKEKCLNVRCIKVAVSSSLILHKMLYSDYKSHTTVKVMV